MLAGSTGIEAVCVSHGRSACFNTSIFSRVSECERIGQQEFIGVGAGETVAEGIGRGLQKSLAEVLGKRQANQLPSVFQIQLSAIEDKHCQFYLQALTRMKGAPIIGLRRGSIRIPCRMGLGQVIVGMAR